MFPYQPSQGLDAPAYHAYRVCSKGRKICLRDPESFSGMKDAITRGQGGPYVSPADVLETVKLRRRPQGMPAPLVVGSSLSRTEPNEGRRGKRAWTARAGPSVMNASPGSADLVNSAEWHSPTERWKVKTRFVRVYRMRVG